MTFRINIERDTNLFDLLAVLEKHESGHSADSDLSSDIGDLVDVDLEELDTLGEFLGVGVNLGGNDLTGSAPGGVEVDDGNLVLGNGGVELVDARDELAYTIEIRQQRKHPLPLNVLNHICFG